MIPKPVVPNRTPEFAWLLQQDGDRAMVLEQWTYTHEPVDGDGYWYCFVSVDGPNHFHQTQATFDSDTFEAVRLMLRLPDVKKAMGWKLCGHLTYGGTDHCAMMSCANYIMKVRQ